MSQVGRCPTRSSIREVGDGSQSSPNKRGNLRLRFHTKTSTRQPSSPDQPIPGWRFPALCFTRHERNDWDSSRRSIPCHPDRSSSTVWPALRKRTKKIKMSCRIHPAVGGLPRGKQSEVAGFFSLFRSRGDKRARHSLLRCLSWPSSIVCGHASSSACGRDGRQLPRSRL